MNFREWVTSHNPQLNWDFDHPGNLRVQLVGHIKECGNFNLEEIFYHFFVSADSGLCEEQKRNFIKYFNDQNN